MWEINFLIINENNEKDVLLLEIFVWSEVKWE